MVLDDDRKNLLENLSEGIDRYCGPESYLIFKLIELLLFLIFPLLFIGDRIPAILIESMIFDGDLIPIVRNMYLLVVNINELAHVIIPIKRQVEPEFGRRSLVPIPSQKWDHCVYDHNIIELDAAVLDY